jgi:hypothetical protein
MFRMNISVSSGTDRFADYFVISGLDLSSGLEPDRFAGELCLLDVFCMLQLNIKKKTVTQQMELSYYLRMISQFGFLIMPFLLFA